MSARILVVDDILPNVKLLEAKLSNEYYEVLTATNGPDALKSIEQDRPDLVLLDVMMPGMDGFEVCTKIKQDPASAHIPVVMVTALTDSEDKVRGLQSGADDFLSKPVNDIALMARVRSLVRLKMTVDEWRARETTASQLGVVDERASVMDQPVNEARILIIEDQDFEAEKIENTLSADDAEITKVTGGMDALSKTADQDFELIIVSLNLGNEDGLRLCSHMRSNEKTRNVPIIMLATSEDMPRIAQGLEIGVHDYILRPLDKNELLARVRTQIRRRRFQDKLRANYEVSLSMALKDSLTGLYNRRYMEVHLEKMLQKNKESQKQLCVMLFDIDYFKQVNDTFGHAVGDQILKHFAFRIEDSLRSFDLVARIGGEEFVVVLPDVSEATAHFIAERLRRTISDKPIRCDTPEGKLSISTSIGGTMVSPQDETDVNGILKRADKMLYEAKEAGRNCTVFEVTGKLEPEDFRQEERKFLE